MNPGRERKEERGKGVLLSEIRQEVPKSEKRNQTHYPNEAKKNPSETIKKGTSQKRRKRDPSEGKKKEESYGRNKTPIAKIRQKKNKKRIGK
jgi:hypothetical protein